jgi:hypothetical protein
LQRTRECAIYVRKYGRHRTEIGGDGQNITRELRLHDVAYPAVHVHIRSPKAVYRLLGVSDQKQLSRTQAPVEALDIVALTAEQEQNFALDRIGILKFVDQNVTVSARKRLPDSRAVSQQVACLHQQVVEIEQGGVALELLIRLPKLGYCGDKAGNDQLSNLAAQLAEGCRDGFDLPLALAGELVSKVP